MTNSAFRRIEYLIPLLIGVVLWPGPLVGQATKDSTGGVRFDFQGVELQYVLAALADAGRLNVVFGQIPARPVTLRIADPVPRDEVRAVLESVAAANGLAITAEGSLLRIEARAAPPAALPQTSATTHASSDLHVYRVRHARAGRLGQTLQELFGVRGASMANDNQTLTDELRAQAIPFVNPNEAPNQPAGQTMRNVGMPAGNGSIHIVPDEMTNSLIIRASESEWNLIQRAISQLDLRPLQVLIEVLIVEVRKLSDDRVGISAEHASSKLRGSDATLGGTLFGPSSGDFVLEIMNLAGGSLDVVLTALSARANVSIVSRPVLLAQNNQKARILVGQERPFVQVFRALPTDAAVRDQVVQYRDVGTVLTIRPTINVDGYVSLEITQEVSIATNETQFGAPVISTREASTQLLVKNDQTVAIGGLADRQSERGRSGIPILKDIPLLGALFGTTTRVEARTELFLFITPHVIEADEDADRIREELKNSLPDLRKRIPVQPTLVRPRADSVDVKR